MEFSDWWFGLVGPSFSAAVLYTVITTQMTIVAVTVYLHRHSAHRSLDLHPGLKAFFRSWLWVSTGMGTRAWTAVHRKHHAMTETEKDPHSPYVHGLREILLRGTEYYRAAITPETIEQYGGGTPNDWLENNLYQRTNIGVGIYAVVDLILFGSAGVVIWAIQMLWIPVWAAGVINGVGHTFGYRNFETPDKSRNIVPWAFFIGGEELHNNHHTYPNSAKLSVKPWEFDIGWMWVRIFETLGLATAKTTAPVFEQVEGKKTIDMDTLWGVLNDRFRVMAHYAERVVTPMVKLEYSRADATTRRLLRRAKSVLCSHDLLISENDRHRISEIVSRFPSLALIYEKRLELTDLWSRRTESNDEFLTAFREWCAEAEASGVKALDDFVSHLRSYSIPRLAAATS